MFLQYHITQDTMPSIIEGSYITQYIENIEKMVLLMYFVWMFETETARFAIW